MTDTDILDEPPDENEAFENLDEALDDEDGVRPGTGPEGQRDLDTNIVVDQAELEEAGANLDDPERISLLDGGMDDPDGSGPAPRVDDDEAGWDVDPVTHGAARRFDGTDGAGADGDGLSDRDLVDVPPLDDEDDVRYRGLDLDEIPDDAPGLDGGR